MTRQGPRGGTAREPESGRGVRIGIGEIIQRRRQQRRAEVLDSSDEDSVASPGWEAPRSGSPRSRALTSSTFISGNLSRVPPSLSNGRIGVEEAETEGAETDDTAWRDDNDRDDDDELMNPYIMNPFPNNRSNEGGLRLDSAALLPPSLELATIPGRDNGRRIPPPRPPTPQSLRPQPQERQQERHEAATSPPKNPKSALASFDPYGPSPLVRAQELRRPYPEMEEESVEFFFPPRNKGKGGESRNDAEGEKLESHFGPLLDGEDRFSLSSSSFSPFPKHRPRKEYEANGAHREGTPLIPSSFAGRHGSGSAWAPSRGMGAILGAVVNLFNAILSTTSYAATYLVYGDLSRRESGNPFSKSHHAHRLNVRMSNHTGRRWGMLSRLRLIGVAMGALFCVGTVAVVRHVPDAADTVMEATVKGGYGVAGRGGLAPHRPASLVLKKKGGKKRGWWSRKRAETGGQQPHTEVYRNGKEEVVVPAVQVEPGDGEGQGDNRAREDVPVLVRTEEDGTMLIRLPPPKLGLEGQGAGGAENLPQPPLRPPQPLLKHPPGDAADEGETMYIRLPYPQQLPHAQRQQRPRRTLMELDPPPRGAGLPQPQLRSDASKSRRFRPAPPLEDPHRADEHHQDVTGHRHHHVGGLHSHQVEPRRVLGELWDEFELWMGSHSKEYGTHEEKVHRFDVWRRNHARIKEKNQRHGPCRMTGKAVFGHNMFSDLDPEEFLSRFLTGYRGPRANHHSKYGRDQDGEPEEGGPRARFQESERGAADAGGRMSPRRHPTIQRNLEEHTAAYGGGSGERAHSRLHGQRYTASTFHGCSWWDVSCLLRWLFGYQFIGGTREPVYDEDSYPSSLDWRSMGVVTEVHSQGSCGACWAITAVETIESAFAIATGQLMDLDEQEVIACDGTCEMCNGGWPQNAYRYAMKHGGLPAKSSYDADWLYTLTAVLAGEGDGASESEMASYFAQICPMGYREGGDKGSAQSGSGSHHSGDNQEYDYSAYDSSTQRYGNINGYGYATDRCICYTDGSGCDCDDQDEKTAVLNVASYGPAAVCLEASQWQNYEGGIMTSDIGCSASFLDMNHCVEVVGYAFTDGNEMGGEGGQGGSDSGSSSQHSSSHRNGSGDDREGYWIVKNQWSNYWGMNGYAYVAMGGNTCGILNDMTQVYME